MNLIKAGILLIVLTAFIYPQGKYLVYFKDKGVTENRLNKNSVQYQQAVEKLSVKSIERRKKAMGENFITFEDLPVFQPYVDQLLTEGVVIKHKLKWFNAVSAMLTSQQLEKIKSYDFVSKVETVKKLKYKNRMKSFPAEQVNKSVKKINSGIDYGFSLTQLELSDIPLIHKNGITGEGVLLGFMDTGFNWEAVPSLSSLDVIDEYDFVFDDSLTANEAGDDSGQDSHGTGVFSIAAGYQPGSLIGPAFGASFLLSKTEDIRSETRVEEDNYAAALEWMEGLGVDITQSSLGYSDFDGEDEDYVYADMNGSTTICTKAAELAFNRGVLVFTSAGNEGNYLWHYITAPADGFNTIAVGAVTSDNLIASFSSRGPSSDGRIKPDITAQGVSVYHSNRSGSISYGNGTSYAGPLAAGISTLMLSVYPDLDNVQLRELILRAGDQYENPDNDYGYGLLSAKRLIESPVYLETDGNKKISKVILTENGVKQESVKVYVKNSSNDFVEYPLEFDGDKINTFELPKLNDGESLEFYYTYSDSADYELQDPLDGTYIFIPVGGDVVSVNSSGSKNSNVKNYKLYQNYPNPFNPSTRISYEIYQPGNVRLSVYDLLGREVGTLVNKFQDAGSYNNVEFDASNLSSGIYIYRLAVSGSGQNFTAIKKMMLIK